MRTALTDAGLALREHLVWRPADALRHGAELVKWPFERLAWAVRRGIFWRAGDRFAALGPVSRGATFGLIVMVAAGAGVTGLLLAAPDRTSEKTPAAVAVAVTPDPVVASTPTAKPAPKPRPTLQGASPIFKPESEGDKAGKKKAGGGKGSSSSSSTSSPVATSGSGQPKPLPPVLSSSGKPLGATTSTSARKSEGKDTLVAGPKALATARRFAAAFVLYETGRGEKQVRKTFARTTSPELRHSLLRRPPRLPANVKVPRAKVLNVVPGPAQDGVYSVSVALLRVGLTSELRLDLEPVKGKRWQVTNILG